MEKIGVIGAGSWGTALAILLNENGNDVTLWSHRADGGRAHAAVTGRCSKLPGIKIPESGGRLPRILQAGSIAGKRCLCMVVPSRCSARDGRASEVSVSLPGLMIISAAKGIEDENTFYND